MARSCFPDDRALLGLIKQRVDEVGAGGLVLGVVDADGARRIVSHGTAGAGARPLDAETVFEIGSITKAFTGILLAEMAARGEVDPSAPARRYAPHFLLPTRGGRDITLLDLATHRSGLPRLPSNLSPSDPANPYADFSLARMNAFLAGYALPRDIGSAYEYSNLGVGLLGEVLAAHAGVDYETLVRQRILAPLGMTRTGITLTREMKTRMAVGHSLRGQPTSLWNVGTLAGAGALRSNAVDLLAFLAANLGEPATDLERAMRASHPSPGTGVGLGWHAIFTGQGRIVYHNGGTGGFRSFLGFDPIRGCGLTLLANAGPAVDDLAMRLFEGAGAMMRGSEPPTIDVAVEILERYVGRYAFHQRLNEVVTLDVAIAGSGLVLQIDNHEPTPLRAISETEFLVGTSETHVSFLVEDASVVRALTWHRPHFSRTVKKVR